jgi:hypothetical protein
MSTENVIDLVELIDASLATLTAAKVPPVPSFIADNLAEVLLRDVSAEDYARYRTEILVAVHERLTVFLSQGRDFDFSKGSK